MRNPLYTFLKIWNDSLKICNNIILFEKQSVEMKSCRCEKRKNIYIYIFLVETKPKFNEETFPTSSWKNFNKYVLFCTLIIEKGSRGRDTRGENYQRLKEEGYYIESLRVFFKYKRNKFRSARSLPPSSTKRRAPFLESFFREDKI